MSEIAELWRLPDKRVTWMDGTVHSIPQLALRKGTWMNFYKVLPGEEQINVIPEGSTLMITEDQWL